MGMSCTVARFQLDGKETVRPACRNLVPRPVGGLGGDGVRRRRAIGGRGFAAGRGGNSAEEADAGNGQDPHAPCTSCGIERVRRGQPAPGGDPAPA